MQKTSQRMQKKPIKKSAHLFCFACRLVLRHAGGVTERAWALAAVFRVAGGIVDDGTRGNSQGNAGE
jgi:hypothetical protein